MARRDRSDSRSHAATDTKAESLVRLRKLATIEKTAVLGILDARDQKETVELDRMLLEVLQHNVTK